MSRNRSENQTEIINFELFTIIEKQNAGGGDVYNAKNKRPHQGLVNDKKLTAACAAVATKLQMLKFKLPKKKMWFHGR